MRLERIIEVINLRNIHRLHIIVMIQNRIDLSALERYILLTHSIGHDSEQNRSDCQPYKHIYFLHIL